MNIYVNQNIPFIKESLTKSCLTIDNINLDNKSIIQNNIKALFIRSNEKITPELLKNTDIDFIVTATSGTDHISSGIPHYSIPGANANSVAEYVIFAISKYLMDDSLNPNNLTIGIIGYGNIGKLVAYYAHQMGLKVLINDPPLLEANEIFPDYTEHVQLDTLLKESNIITNHIPLTKIGKNPTYRLLDYDRLYLIKPNALLIHTSRGGVIDEEALKRIVAEKNLTLAIDVWQNEPQIDFDLLKFAKIATPHLAGYSYNGKIKASYIALKYFEKHTGIMPDYSILEHKFKQIQINDSVDFSNIKDIYEKLDKYRNFSEDNVQFRKIAELNKDKFSDTFKHIRQNYPKRYEVFIPPSELNIIYKLFGKVI